MSRLSSARALLAGALLACGWVAAPAHADVRTASGTNRYPEPKPSIPTRPQLRDARVSLDTDAGRIDVTVDFADPLPDPAATRALRKWEIRVSLGDWMGFGDCEGAPETSPSLDAGLGDDRAGVLSGGGDGEGPASEFPDTPAAKTFSADRSTVTLSATAPALVGLNLICAEVEVGLAEGGAESSTLAMMFDGYSVVDGGFQREATRQLDYEVQELDTEWLDTRPETFTPPGSRCDPPVGETVACRVTTRLRDVPGRPKLSLRGVLKVDVEWMKRSDPRDGIPWGYAVRGRVSWRRCPSFGGTTRRALRGRACHLNVRWNGHDGLFRAVPHAKLLRG